MNLNLGCFSSVMREKDKDCRLFMQRMNLGAKM